MLTEDDRRRIEQSVLCWLSTVSEAGHPSVSPKEIFSLQDDVLLIANVASPNSARNVKAHAQVCVACLDIFVQKGVQLFGTARLLTKADDQFEHMAAPLRAIAGEAFPFASLFRIEITQSKPIIAPRYRLFPETTEASQIASAMATCGVRPIE